MIINKGYLLFVALSTLISCSSTTNYDIKNDDTYKEYDCIATKNNAVIIKMINTCNEWFVRNEGQWRLHHPTEEWLYKLKTERELYSDIIDSSETYCDKRTAYQDYISLPNGTNIKLEYLKSFYSQKIGVPMIIFKGSLTIDDKEYEIYYRDYQTNLHPNSTNSNNHTKRLVVDITEYLDTNFSICTEE